MTVTAPALLTYDDYMAEGEVFKRYDIVDGVRIFMTNPTRRHQRIVKRITRALDDYEAATGKGETILAPSDILITRVPLRTRQPDVLFISHARLAQCGADTDPAPLVVGPELVVEVLSSNESARARASKIQDYCRVGVDECWVVNPTDETVEVVRLTVAGAESIAVYRTGETVRSAVFPDLAVDVSPIFAL